MTLTTPRAAADAQVLEQLPDLGWKVMENEVKPSFNLNPQQMSLASSPAGCLCVALLPMIQNPHPRAAP